MSRKRAANSPLYLAEQWGISVTSAKKLLKIPEHELPLFVGMAKKASAAQIAGKRKRLA